MKETKSKKKGGRNGIKRRKKERGNSGWLIGEEKGRATEIRDNDMERKAEEKRGKKTGEKKGEERK